MALELEGYALIGDLHTAALVGRNGSIDWLCLPSFASDACFAALLGNEQHGSFVLAPARNTTSTRRRYLADSLVLETVFEDEGGAVRVLEFMPPRTENADLIRIVSGVRGRMDMKLRCALRLGYGAVIPWLTRVGDKTYRAVAGPDSVRLCSTLRLAIEDDAFCTDFCLQAGESESFVLSWSPSHRVPPPPIDPELALENTLSFWHTWSAKCTYHGRYREAVVRSLITLKALTYAPTGGLVAAATTSLPERWGGVRNWDYRFCWLRDASFTLYALLEAGYHDEARAWRAWLLRAVAGKADQLQIMYGLAGERRLSEETLDWLPGYGGAHPVRLGNAAHAQFQLDVFGEVFHLMYGAAHAGIVPTHAEWALLSSLLDELADRWREPDNGIWEVRDERQHFTHSKIMAWVAFDRGIRMAEEFALEGPLPGWRKQRAEIHADVCNNGFSSEMGSFTRTYGSRSLDASLLEIPHLGFLPVDDSRVEGTIRAIARDLGTDGFVRRYDTEQVDDGLPPGEGMFLLCTFWLVDDWALLGETARARELFERLLALRSDVGLLSEQYDPKEKRLQGNFPQAFSHVALVNAALRLAALEKNLEDRSKH